MDRQNISHLLSVLGVAVVVTVTALFAVIKYAFWFFDNRYITKQECTKNRATFGENVHKELHDDYVTKENFMNLKEDVQEIKAQNTEILNILMHNKNV